MQATQLTTALIDLARRQVAYDRQVGGQEEGWVEVWLRGRPEPDRKLRKAAKAAGIDFGYNADALEERSVWKRIKRHVVH